MKHNEIKIIDENWLNSEICRLKLELKELLENRRPLIEPLPEVEILNLIKSKLTSATPILKEAFNEGENNISHYGGDN
jgi:hypothetical protein